MIGSIGSGGGFKVQADLGAASGGGQPATTSSVSNNLFVDSGNFPGIMPGGCFPPPGGPQPGVPNQNQMIQKLLGVVLQLLSMILGQLGGLLGGNKPGPTPLPAPAGNDFVAQAEAKYLPMLSPDQQALYNLEKSV